MRIELIIVENRGKELCSENISLFNLYVTKFHNIYLYIYEQSDSKSYVKLAGFRSQLLASYVSSHTEVVIQ